MISDILVPTIMQLRAYCAPLGGRVAGAANFELGLQKYNTNMGLPAAFVVPLNADSDGFSSMTGTYQFVRQMLAIIVELDARADRRGQDPAELVAEIESSLCASLLNWVPAQCMTQNNQGFWFAGRRFLDLDRARLFYEWDFALNTILDDSDAWQEPAIPLISIEVDIYTAPPWEMPPADGRPPAAIIKIDTLVGTTWDDGTIWDDGATSWDIP